MDARELLTYEVAISQPDSYGDPWWQVGNAASPAQAAAALSELATRCARELTLSSGRCWFVCDIRFADNVQVDYSVGSIRTEHLAHQLRETAERVLDVAATGSHGATGSRNSAPPR